MVERNSIMGVVIKICSPASSNGSLSQCKPGLGIPTSDFIVRHFEFFTRIVVEPVVGDYAVFIHKYFYGRGESPRKNLPWSLVCASRSAKIWNAAV